MSNINVKVETLKDLYPKIYEAYMEEQKKQGNNPDDSINVSCPRHRGGFCWAHSKLGPKFWSAINEGKKAKAKKIAPHLFMDEDKFKEYSVKATELKFMNESIKFNKNLAKDLILGAKYQDVGMQKKARKLSVELIKKVEIQKGLAYRIELELKAF